MPPSELDEYARRHSACVDALEDWCSAGAEPRAAVDALEEHIGATAEAGTIARLRSKLENISDPKLRAELAKLLE